MPRRTRRQIDLDNRALERALELLQTGLKTYRGKPQAAEIRRHIQSNAVLSAKIEKDLPLLRLLWGDGLEPVIRDALARWGILTPPGETAPQLDLFPENERDLVRQIGMARLWLPSKGAHVQYNDLSGAALEEAAAFYDALGQGNLRTAGLLRQLATLRHRPNKSTRRRA